VFGINPFADVMPALESKSLPLFVGHTAGGGGMTAAEATAMIIARANTLRIILGCRSVGELVLKVYWCVFGLDRNERRESVEKTRTDGKRQRTINEWGLMMYEHKGKEGDGNYEQ
jgi:hypothetical protein